MRLFSHETIDGCVYTRISKGSARKAYNQGYEIIIAPLYIRMNNNPWFHYTIMSKQRLEEKYGYKVSFDNFINEYEFYNCNNEFGKYCKYYVTYPVYQVVKGVQA